MPSSKAIRAVAVLEGLKGVVVLLAATGLLALLHHDTHRMVAVLIEHAHLNPASRYPKIFVDAAGQLADPRLWQLAAGATMYSIVRLIEGYGLYRERAWAEVLAALSGAIYVPFELMELMHRPTGLAASLLALNLAVVVLMLHTLSARRKAARSVAYNSMQRTALRAAADAER
jgi:uncharacterized membrane protein (DUF2068 family)